MLTKQYLSELIANLQPLYSELANHPIYGSFNTIDDLHVFMETHVFAVWDFMCLLKALQNKLTCTTLPWKPNHNNKSARFVNEIVVGEESDCYNDAILSHFEIYLVAMREAGVSVAAIDTFLKLLNEDVSWEQALVKCNAPQNAQQFVKRTFSIIASNQAHKIAAAFTFGREDIIPEMFRALLVSKISSSMINYKHCVGILNATFMSMEMNMVLCL